MARSYVLNYVHCVFSTKQRTQLIRDPQSLWAYIRGIARNRKFDLLAVGGTADHVHLLMALPASQNLADVMRDIKANSSRHLRAANRGRMVTQASASAPLGSAACGRLSVSPLRGSDHL